VQTLQGEASHLSSDQGEEHPDVGRAGRRTPGFLWLAILGGTKRTTQNATISFPFSRLLGVSSHFINSVIPAGRALGLCGVCSELFGYFGVGTCTQPIPVRSEVSSSARLILPLNHAAMRVNRAHRLFVPQLPALPVPFWLIEEHPPRVTYFIINLIVLPLFSK
jgi:hypothetical protein